MGQNQDLIALLKSLKPYSIIGPILMIISMFLCWLTLFGREVSNGVDLIKVFDELKHYSDDASLYALVIPYVLLILAFVFLLGRIQNVQPLLDKYPQLKLKWDFGWQGHLFRIIALILLIAYYCIVSDGYFGVGAGFWVCFIGAIIVCLRSVTELYDEKYGASDAEAGSQLIGSASQGSTAEDGITCEYYLKSSGGAKAFLKNGTSNAVRVSVSDFVLCDADGNVIAEGSTESGASDICLDPGAMSTIYFESQNWVEGCDVKYAGALDIKLSKAF